MKKQRKETRKKIFEKIALTSLGVVFVIILIYLISHANSDCTTHLDDLKTFLNNHIPESGSKNTLFDLDDIELIDQIMNDSNLRAEYGVSDTEFNRYLLEMV